MARDIANEPQADTDEFFIEIPDAPAEAAPKAIGMLSLSVPTIATPTIVAPNMSKLYKFSSDGRKKKPAKKRSRKKRAKKHTSPAESPIMSLGTRARTRARRVSIYRIDTSDAIRIYANHNQANLAGEHLSRDVRTILQHEYFIKLRDKQKLLLHGIRPAQVQVMADGTVAIKLAITEKYEHSYSATYTVDSFEEVRRKVTEGVPGATLGYTSKNPTVLRHILSCLNVQFTESEFTTLVGKLNDSIRYDDQLRQEVKMSRRNIFFTRRISKSIKLLGPRKAQAHRPASRRKGRRNKSARLLWPERIKKVELVECITCHGKGTINMKTTTIAVSGTSSTTMDVKCIDCKGSGEITKKKCQEIEELREWSKTAWCECGSPSGTTYHSEDGQTDYCSCNDCGLLTQVG